MGWAKAATISLAALTSRLVDAVIVQEQCRVEETMVDSWLRTENADQSKVRLPKVKVQVVTSAVQANFTSTFATRYGRAYSESPPIDYGDNGPQDWLSNFTVGSTWPCWIDPMYPDDVSLEIYEPPGVVDMAEFLIEHHQTLIGIYGLLLVVVLICSCLIVRYKDPGVDVVFPSVRKYCFAFFPWILIMSYFGAWACTMTIGSKHLQHKYYQPLLFGTFLLSLIIFLWTICNPFCWKLVPTNLTLVLGGPAYFFLFWTILFVTLVPGFNWLHEGKNIIAYTTLFFKTFGQISKSLFHITLLVLFFVYRDRIMRAFGIDGGGGLSASIHDLVDPFYRRNNYIGVKVAVLDIVGKLPARSNPTGANNLFVSVQCAGGEAAHTRVHNAQPAETVDSKVYRFHEVIQVNIPMDKTSPDLIFIKVLDQGALSTEEIARTVVSVSEVYECFFSGSDGHLSNTDKDLHIGSKIRFFDRKNGSHLPDLEQSAKSFELQFINFRGPAYLWLSFLPANEEAEKYLKTLYSGGICDWICSFFGRGGGVGSPGAFEGGDHEYGRLEQVMVAEATRPLTSRNH